MYSFLLIFALGATETASAMTFHNDPAKMNNTSHIRPYRSQNASYASIRLPGTSANPTISIYQCHSQDIIRKLNRDLIHRRSEDLVVVPVLEMDISGVSSEYQFRTIKSHLGPSDLVFSHLIHITECFTADATATTGYSASKLFRWTSQIMYLIHDSNESMSVLKHAHQLLTQQFRNGTAHQREILYALTPGLGVVVAETQLFEDTKVAEVVISLFGVLLHSKLQSQRADMLGKCESFLSRNQRSCIGLQTAGMDQKLWTKIQDAVHALRSLVFEKRKSRRRQMREKLCMLTAFGQSLLSMKSIINIAHIIHGWKSEGELQAMNIHVTITPPWLKTEWKLFDRILDMLPDECFSRILKYSVESLSWRESRKEVVGDFKTLFQRYKLNVIR